MKFYIDGSTLGISLSLWGFLFLTYIIIECYLYYKSKIILLQRLLINIRLRVNLRKSLPPWIKLHKMNFDMYKWDRYGRFIIVPVLYRLDESILPDDLKKKHGVYRVPFYGQVKVTRFGRRISNFNDLDNKVSDDIKKKYKRDYVLDKILTGN